jgi:peptidoglycan hydrolase-like protein with peptidoglycan-binding domain
MTRGEVVRDLQTRLVNLGYDVGGADGVFGSGTETALMWFQYDLGLEVSGVVDVASASALGYPVPPGSEPAAAPVGEPAAEPVPESDPAPAEDPQEAPEPTE